ncbi:hypothetical protein C8Q74DRAFT_1369565 [Fomes fomentarius]|nr:hypothetical protein C8Q74DRAFT_1369565 [Fomes fomentarius]
MIFPFTRAAILVASLLVASAALVSASESATNCASGSFSKTGKSPCALCDPGTFQPDVGQMSCRKAQKGWFAAGPGAASQSICQQGTYSTNEGQGACTICPAGSYCNGKGQTQPALCPPGHYSPVPGLGQMCHECPKGTFVSTRGATACCFCCSGFYTDQTAQDHCFDCPVRGAFSPLGATSAQQCGKSPGSGLTQCKMSGEKCPNGGGSSPTGMYRGRSVRRDACPKGHKNCPVYGLTPHGRGYLRAYECVDVRNDLESCGGCAANDSPFGERAADGGRDCSAIPNVDSVTCMGGECVIAKCSNGHRLSPDGANCVASFNVQARHDHL